MTWANRFRLFFGLVVVVIIVGALTILFSQRNGEATSSTASIAAVEYPVGTDYPGAVIAASVEPGDMVRVGDPIATIHSSALVQALAMGAPISSNEVYDISEDGTITAKSTVDGVVMDVAVQQGGYAASGGTIATIAATDELYVEAQYSLDPKDYSRVERGATVSLELPNGETIAGTVESFEVDTEDGTAVTTVRIESEELEYDAHDGLIAPGTPLVATLELRNDDVLARLVELAKSSITDAIRMITQ